MSWDDLGEEIAAMFEILQVPTFKGFREFARVGRLRGDEALEARRERVRKYQRDNRVAINRQRRERAAKRREGCT